ncbi:cytochrome P450 [Kitasatospora sp. MBT66]|uniref:cytochrome P450 n=1 Tax=Kitasatospora sp. MBT66 TaxID=1444769 RepID=UPI0005BA4215|nr:cytochrome P450 [Kitasatospora sp. MBT66]
MSEQDAPPISIFYRRDGLDPGPALGEAQREDPVRRVRDFWLHRTGEYWLVTRHADVRRVLADQETFAMYDAQRAPILPNELLNMDPPEHTRLRRVLTPEFTGKRIRALEPMIRARTGELIDAMEARGPAADLMADFALPLPLGVICALLGVPDPDQGEFHRWSRTTLDLGLPMEERLAAGRESHAYTASLVAEKRRSPDDGMIGMLVREHGDAVSDAELVGVCELLLLAGHVTVSNTIGLAVLALLARPEQAARLREADEADPVIDGAVEELLRYLSVSSTALARTARYDTEIGGVPIKAGDQVVCQLPVANRDPELGAGTDRLDIGRKPLSHLAFGHGPHHCLGAPLARAELRIALPALLRRLPGLALACPAEEVSYRVNNEVYGLHALPVTW